jgi:hypothetical protein
MNDLQNITIYHQPSIKHSTLNLFDPWFSLINTFTKQNNWQYYIYLIYICFIIIFLIFCIFIMLRLYRYYVHWRQQRRTYLISSHRKFLLLFFLCTFTKIV